MENNFDMSEETNLMNTRENILNQINEKYTCIGERYFNAHTEETTDEYPEIAEIRGLQDEIKRIDQQLNELKGIIICPRCGFESSLDSTFCAACGLKLPKRISSASSLIQERHCPQCGILANPGQRFCIQCGAKLEDENAFSGVKPMMTTDSVQDAYAGIQESVQEKNIVKKCPICGAVVGDDDVYCMECGMKL